MFLIMIFNFLSGFINIYAAGFISPTIQAALGFVEQLYFLIIIIINAINIGTIALISRAAGAGDHLRAVAVARQSLLFGGFSATVIMITGILFSRTIIAVAGFPPETRDIASFFFRVFAIMLLPNAVLIISNAIFQASGEVKKPLLTMAFVTIVHIALLSLFVFGFLSFPSLGYQGIAAATVLSITAGMAVNLILFSLTRWRAIYAFPPRTSLETMRRIAGLGWPVALLQVAWNAGSIILYNILGRLGDKSITALASITAGLRIEAIIYLPAFALNMAASVLIGQNLGAGNSGRAEETGWKIAKAGVVLMSSMAVIIFILAEPLARILTNDPHVHAETVRYLRFNMLSEPFMALSVVLGGCLQGAGDTRGAMWVIVRAMWLIRLPLAYLLAIVLGYGAPGVWGAMVISMCVQGLLMTARFRSGRWKTVVVD